MDCTPFERGEALSRFSALEVDEVQELQGAKWIMSEAEQGR